MTNPELHVYQDKKKLALDRKTPDFGDGRAGQQEDEILAAHHQHEAPPHQAPLLNSGPCGSAVEPEQFGPNPAFHEVSDPYSDQALSIKTCYRN
jgi:hypothetical protein